MWAKDCLLPFFSGLFKKYFHRTKCYKYPNTFGRLFSDLVTEKKER